MRNDKGYLIIALSSLQNLCQAILQQDSRFDQITLNCGAKNKKSESECEN